jgi:hypothetical protein
MTLGLLFWVLYIVSLVFGFWSGYTTGQPFPFKSWGGGFLLFVLVGLLGWAVFGAPVK